LEPEKAHSTGEFVIVEKFGDYVLRCLASCLLNVITQAGRRRQKFLTFRIQYLAFGNYVVVSTLYSALVVPRLFCFLHVRYSQDAFYGQQF